MKKIIDKVNVARVACDHLFGEEHTPKHRMGAGFVIMIVGVTVAKVGGGVHALILHFSLDLIGYLIHGIGAVPFIEALIDASKARDASKVDTPLPTIELD